MRVNVLLFGPAALAAGRRQVVVQLDAPHPPTAAALARALSSAEPRIEPHVQQGRLAINHAFADPEQVIREGDEVALIAMVSGG